MLVRHQERVDALVSSVRQIAADLFDVPLRATETTEPFRLGPEPYWVTQEWSNTLMPAPATLLLRIAPENLRRKRRDQQVEAQLSALVQHNVENLRWATLRGLNETFRRFSAQLDVRLADVIAVTRGAINGTIERWHSEAHQVAAERRRLQRLDETFGRYVAALARPPQT